VNPVHNAPLPPPPLLTSDWKQPLLGAAGQTSSKKQKTKNKGPGSKTKPIEKKKKIRAIK